MRHSPYLTHGQIQQARRYQSVPTLINRPSPTEPLETWGRRFLPDYYTHPPSLFHQSIDADLQGLHLRRASRNAYIAPRESAKSVWVSLTYVLRCVCEGWESYVIIMSDTAGQSSKFLLDVKKELEDNSELAAAYPEACGRGPLWNETAVRTRNGVTIETLGAGNKIRGRRSGKNRPTLMVLDDLQSNEDIFSERLRTRTWDWVMREVVPAGSETTNYISVGTALHEDAVAVKLLTSPGWVGRSYQAVLDWPERMDLWAEWERLLTNLTDAERDTHAEHFFEARQEEMLRGSRVLWPSYKPLVKLMARRAEIGPSAFASEYQGDPRTSTGSEWAADYFEHPDFWFDEWPADLQIKAYALDPSKGRPGDSPGDWQAHIWGGLDTQGILHVEAAFAREAAGAMIARSLITLTQLYDAGGASPVSAAVIEENIFGELLRDEFERQREASGVPSIPYRPIVNTDSKPVRIRRLDGRLSRRQIRIRNTLGGRELAKQLRGFPNAAHDDGPDALEMLDREITRLALGRAKDQAAGSAKPTGWAATPMGKDPRKMTF
jgi:predicted phage terminase large subunit-like protein